MPFPPKGRDFLELDPGSIKVMQRGAEVGQVFVEETSDPSVRIEHWVLYSNYRAPSPQNKLELAVPSIPYEPTASGKQRFFSDMRARKEADSNKSYLYVQANCVWSSKLPGE